MSSVFSAIGVATASSTGVAAKLGVVSASGSGVAAAIGSSNYAGSAAADGSSSVSFTGVPAGIAAASGGSSASGFASTATATSVGSSTVQGFSPAAAASASGVSAAIGYSTALGSGMAESIGVAEASGEGTSGLDSAGDEVEALFASHVVPALSVGEATDDASPQAATYASSGAASSTVELLEKRQAIAAASGSSTAEFLATLEEVLESSGAAADELAAARIVAIEVSAGASSNDQDVLQRSSAVAVSVGVSSAAALAIGGTAGVGSSIGASSAQWTGIGVTTGTAASAGTSSASGVITGIGAGLGNAQGAAAVLALASGLQTETLVSEGTSEDEFSFPVPAVYPVFWSNTIGAAGATWEGLPFNSMVEIDGVVYAAGAGGLYQLDDLADDDGEAIPANIQWDLADRSDYKQRARSLYVNAIADGPFTVKVANKQGEYIYQTHLPSSTKLVNHRAPIGRGLTSRAQRLSLLHTRYFSVSDVNLESGDTTRRI